MTELEWYVIVPGVAGETSRLLGPFTTRAVAVAASRGYVDPRIVETQQRKPPQHHRKERSSSQ